MVKVAWLQTVIPNYRIELLSGISKYHEIELTCFHGEGKKGYNVESVGKELPVKSVWIKNYFVPFGNGRIFWQSHFWRIIHGDFNLIIVTEAIHNFTVWLIVLLKIMHQKKIVIFGHGTRKDKRTKFFFFKEKIRIFFIRRADAVLVYTEAGKEECVSAGIPSEKIFVFNNSLDTKALLGLKNSVSDKEILSLKKQYDTENKKVLIFIGRLYYQKRVDILIETFKQLRQDSENFILFIIGDGYESEKLREIAGSIADVHFLGSIFDKKELAKYLTISDLLVIPGAMGLTCLHAFAYGIPVVTSKSGVGHGPEIAYIKDNYNGILIDKTDAVLFKKSIMKLLNDPRAFSNMKNNCLNTVEKFSIDNMMPEFIRAIEFASSSYTH
jgi:glycosyltransferase involved in cell wall biosynthesis